MIYKKKFYILAFAVLLLNFSCSAKPEEKLNSSIDDYSNKKTGSIKNIEQAFFNLTSVNSFTADGISFNENMIIQNGSAFRILHPVEISLKLPLNQEIRLFDMNKDLIALSSGKGIWLFSNKGDYISDIPTGDSKSEIKAILFHGNRLIYFMNNTLYYYNTKSYSRGVLSERKFTPPYGKDYIVNLYRSGNSLGILAGSPGSYYFSNFNLETGTAEVTNISVSSSRVCFNENNLVYVFGSTGEWKIQKFDFKNKSKKTILKTGDITDILITKQGIILSSSRGLYLVNFDRTKFTIPFKFEIFGNTEKNLILKYRDKLIAANSRIFFEKIKMLRHRIPQHFTAE